MGSNSSRSSNRRSAELNPLEAALNSPLHPDSREVKNLCEVMCRTNAQLRQLQEESGGNAALKALVEEALRKNEYAKNREDITTFVCRVLDKALLEGSDDRDTEVDEDMAKSDATKLFEISADGDSFLQVFLPEGKPAMGKCQVSPCSLAELFLSIKL